MQQQTNQGNTKIETMNSANRWLCHRPASFLLPTKLLSRSPFPFQANQMSQGMNQMQLEQLVAPFLAGGLAGGFLVGALWLLQEVVATHVPTASELRSIQPDANGVLSRLAKHIAPSFDLQIRMGMTQPPPGFMLLDYTTHPLAGLCESFWGQIEKLEDIKPGDVIEIPCEPLESAGHQLYFFEQYRYMQERIDAFRLQDDMKPERREKGCVVVTGTQGIGERHSTYYLHLTVPLGKTTFLHYYLALQLAQKKTTMFYSRYTLYLFAGKNTI